MKAKKSILFPIAISLCVCAFAGHRIPRPRPFKEDPDTVTISIVGDVMMHTRQLGYPDSTFLAGISSRLSSADLAIANMEFTLAGEPYSGYPAFSAPDSYPLTVQKCGVDVFLTANNHILDKGDAGLRRTISRYRGQEGIMFTGIAEDSLAQEGNYPLMVSVHGLRIAIINFTYGTNLPSGTDTPPVNYMDTTSIAAAIARAHAASPDFIIALPHWGTEYQLQHSPSQEGMAKWLISKGVSAIVGAHPHVVQDFVKAGDVPVFYSVGNCVSNMSAENTRLELMVTLTAVRIKHLPSPIDPAKAPKWELASPLATWLWCTLPGTLTDNYMTIAAEDWLGRRDEWKDPSDYDNMVRTLERVSSSSGIPLPPNFPAACSHPEKKH